jgi:UDP-glucose 4-epimerase
VIQTRWDSPEDLQIICAGVDAVVHLAGMNAGDCGADPVGALEFNGVATTRLLRAAVRQGVKRFIYLSTAHVYGSPLTGVITEQTCPTSPHPYATSHRAGEDGVRAAQQRGEIAGIVIRLSNAYGVPAHKDANCWMLLVNDLCRQAVTSNRMVLHSSGMQRRDFITLTDTCRAIGHLLALPADKLGEGLFNAGGAWSPTVLQMTERVAGRILAATGRSPEIARKTGPNTESQELLDYRMQRLIDTGFKAGGIDSVDPEIDALIQFCARQVT